MGSSPTSSMKRVPPRAASKTPRASRSSPSPARRPPKSSRSAFSSEMRLQSTTLKGPWRRAECWCTARAASSLPVPVSPSTSRLMSSRAMRRSSVKTQRIFSEAPTSAPKDSAPATSTSVGRGATFTESFVLPSSTLSPLVR
ncbi:hypothetical protein LILAB_32470 [Corallococcus macrosporus]|uniref:Uncharacterized protein n=1 Tax=Myxococcus fulvus (strain ATCC BAA-855 / HW-1) TaxID=483219 RepID=F8CAZ4_MYXFH|nr:hypothetical protein LILAB_32470 [Corallococcus macrosporus]